jgi:hypothetical protein
MRIKVKMKAGEGYEKQNKKYEIGKGGRYAKPFCAPLSNFFKRLLGRVKEKEVI